MARSVVAQVHRELRLIGSRRNFSSSPPTGNIPDFMSLWVSSSKIGFAIYAEFFNVAKEHPETYRVSQVAKLAERQLFPEWTTKPELDS